MPIHPKTSGDLWSDSNAVGSNQSKSIGFKIGFVIAYENSPYAGVVRPFINWAKELRKQRIEADIILYRSSNKIQHHLDKLKLSHHVVNNIEELRRVFRDKAYEYIVIDDYIKRLKLASEITRYAELIIYSQVLYGIHAIAPVFKLSALPLRYRIIHAVVRIIPFSVLRLRYSKALSKAHLVIANSETTETLLYTLYGVITHDIIYPPVDTNIFKPFYTSKKDQVILYLGSHGGDTDPRLVEKTCTILGEKGVDIIMLGNAKLANTLKTRGCRAECISGISDEELAKLYSESIATLAPQLWEQFGYVIAESIACGTPVIAFNMMGPSEIITRTGLGYLANSEEEFLKIISNLEKSIVKEDVEINPDKLPFSSKNSTGKLVETLISYSVQED